MSRLSFSLQFHSKGECNLCICCCLQCIVVCQHIRNACGRITVCFCMNMARFSHCLSPIVLRGKKAYFEMKFGLFCPFLRIACKINCVNIFSGWFTQQGSSCEIIPPTGFPQLSVSFHVSIFNKLPY